MSSVLIACGDEAETEKIQRGIREKFNLLAIRSPQELAGLVKGADLIVLDHAFTGDSAAGFLKEIVAKYDLPVLFLTPEDDGGCALQALRSGAQGHLVKTPGYHRLLALSIQTALERFEKQKEEKNKVAALQARVKELEQRCGLSRPKIVRVPPGKNTKNMYQEIASRLKTGETQLPTISQIAVKFREMVKKGASVEALTDLLKHDAAISASLIQISNSPYYRGVAKSTTLAQAITRLGTNIAKMQVDFIANRSLYVNTNPEYAPVTRSLWRHSLACALACKSVTEMMDYEGAEENFTLGLLHDVGKLGLLRIVSELQRIGRLDRRVDRAQLLEMMEAHHCEFGATLLKSWRFPYEYLQVALYHSNVEAVQTPPPGLMVVHFANLLVISLGYALAKDEGVDLENTASARFLQLDAERITALKERVGGLVAEWEKQLA